MIQYFLFKVIRIYTVDVVNHGRALSMDFELFLAVEGGGSDGYNGLQAEVRLHDAQLAGPEQFWRWVKGADTSTDFLRGRLSIFLRVRSGS